MDPNETAVSETMRAIPPRCRQHFPPGNWFENLPVEVQRRLPAYGVAFVFDPGEVLVEEGVPNEWLHIILKGRVELEYVDPRSGRPTKVFKLAPGCITGDRGVLAYITGDRGTTVENLPIAAEDLPIVTARAVTEVTTYRFSYLALALAVLSVRGAVAPFVEAIQRTIDEVELRRQLVVAPEIRERAEELFPPSRPPQPAANGIPHTEVSPA
jgi:CRP-like cAMP-binding protein